MQAVARALGMVKSSRTHTFLIVGAIVTSVFAAILAVHIIDQNARLRMDASRVVADIEGKVDEETFVSWAGVAGSVKASPLQGEMGGLHSSIAADLQSLRADGVDAATVDTLRSAVQNYDTALLSGVVQINGGSIDLQSQQSLTVLAAYERMHLAAASTQQGLVAREDTATLVQEIGSTSLMLGICGLVIGLVWTAQRRRRRAAVALTETEALRRSERSFRVLFEDSPRPMWVLDPRTLAVLAVNNAAVSSYGYEREDLLQMNVSQIIAEPGSAAGVAAITALRSGSRAAVASRHRLRDGRLIDVDVRSDLLDFNGHHGLLMLAEDVTERTSLERQLRHQAFHDPLTGLPNRELFRERLQRSLTRLGRGDLQCAVILIDLDDFKTINDSLGHLAGDDLLMQVAQRLPSVMRPGDTVARLGGDEFAILVEDITSSAVAATVAERIAAGLQSSFDTMSSNVSISASMGIAASALDGTSTTETLLRDADVAMYAAKARGEGGWTIFGEDMHHQVQRRLELRGALGHAIENRELVVHYQPLVDLRTHEVTGVEALVRWNHPTRGLLQPVDFITLAEETGKISQIGSYVLTEAAACVRRWQDQVGDSRRLELSVNVSYRELLDDEFVPRTLRILGEAGLDPRQLTMEMTESMLMQDPARAIAMLGALRRHGISIAMDDFGTGYSSLTYLRRMPLDVVKIDRSFVMSLGGDGGDLSMTVAIVRLLDTLNVVTVAEGVETREQMEYVSAMGCDRGQGHLFSRPLPADSMERLVAAPMVAVATPSAA